MNREISPSQIHGVVSAPSSKSLSHRAIIAAALSRGTSVLHEVLLCDDIHFTIEGLKKLGVAITCDDTTLTVDGTGGMLCPCTELIHLGNSGSSMRFLTAISALVLGKTVLTGSKRLCERPMTDIIEPLAKQGISVTSAATGCPPMTVQGGTLHGGRVSINGSVSSQFASALFLIAPFAKTMTTIHICDARSLPYITLTRTCMEEFGVHIDQIDTETFNISPNQRYIAHDYAVEGDFSSSSYLFAAAAITHGSVVVKNLSANSSQGDAHFLPLLARMGCHLQQEHDGIRITGPVTLTGISVDMKNHPDIVQSLAVVAAYANGTTHITNIGHLKHKETDRILKTAEELRKMGIRVETREESITIHGGTPHAASIETHGDHRMAMSFAVAALGAKGKTIIHDTDVVKKSYPNFFSDLSSVGGNSKERI